MGNKFSSNIYPNILNNNVENELKKYFGNDEIRNIIVKTKTGYDNMIENIKTNEIGKETFENLCINTYFINLYANIENEISRDIFNQIRENVLKGIEMSIVRIKPKCFLKNIFKKG
jgi:hypothetical protein